MIGWSYHALAAGWLISIQWCREVDGAWPKPQPLRSEEGHGCYCRQTILVNCDPLIEDKNILSSTSSPLLSLSLSFFPHYLILSLSPTPLYIFLFPSSLILSLSICGSIHLPFLKSHLRSVSQSHWEFPVICKWFFDLPHRHLSALSKLSSLIYQ